MHGMPDIIMVFTDQLLKLKNFTIGHFGTIFGPRLFWEKTGTFGTNLGPPIGP